MTDEQVDRVAKAIKSIAQGDVHGPAGLEYLAMVLGEPHDKGGSVAANLGRIADAIEAATEERATGSVAFEQVFYDTIAAGFTEIAEAIKGLSL